MLQLLAICFILGLIIEFLTHPTEMIRLIVKAGKKIIRFSVRMARKRSGDEA